MVMFFQNKLLAISASIFIFCCLFNLSCGNSSRRTGDVHDPDEFRNTTQLIRSKNYPAEEHNVYTEDGYILYIQRIPASKKNPTRRNNKVVLLWHGLLDSSATWVVNFENESLAFILADAGYDVWLGNTRGNTYGRRHRTLNVKQDEFWDFSWDQIGTYDVPAVVDYVLKATKQSNLYYIGHSQGCMSLFSQINQFPEFANKLKLFVAMGPVATVGHITSPIKYLAKLAGKPINLYELFGRKDFLPSNLYVKLFVDLFCNIEETDKLLCENILYLFAGPSKYMNNSRISVYTTHAPAGTSMKNIIHYGQMTISNKFQKFDYENDKENLIHYNQTTPPLYNVTNVDVPVALYWGLNDWLADIKDIQYLRANLPQIVDDYFIPDWNHLDFLWAVNGKTTLYDRIVTLLAKY